MKRLSKSFTLISFLIIAGLFFSGINGYGADKSVINPGKNVFETHCVICHGSKRDGKGAGGAMRWREKSGQLLNVQARDLTVGVFKFRSTSTGCLPTNDDLMHIVKDGIPKS